MKADALFFHIGFGVIVTFHHHRSAVNAGYMLPLPLALSESVGGSTKSSVAFPHAKHSIVSHTDSRTFWESILAVYSDGIVTVTVTVTTPTWLKSHGPFILPTSTVLHVSSSSLWSVFPRRNKTVSSRGALPTVRYVPCWTPNVAGQDSTAREIPLVAAPRIPLCKILMSQSQLPLHPTIMGPNTP